MSIKKIIIRNFKSINNLELSFNDKKSIACFLGKNGVGKTNLFNAIEYFYDNLDSINVKNVLDVINTYNSKCEISIVYDLTEFDVKINNDFLKKMFSNLCIIAKEKRENICLSNLTIDQIKVTMTQDKDGVIRWNQSKEVRKSLKKLFPLYVINTRNLDLITWNKVWDTIGDLSAAASQKSDDEINSIIDKAFSSVYESKYIDSKKIVEETFAENNISLDKYHFESRYKYMFMTRFNGEYFFNDGHSLDYYSDGLNSYTYIKILVSLICRISDVSCKSPLIVLDEPEIGLHEAKIEELIESISKSVNDHSFMLINTHSPKLICELVINDIPIDIYRMHMNNMHTLCKKLDTNWLVQQKHIITPIETACYFSDYLLFVEGETEFQLFNNKKLRSLFPFLKDIHIYPNASNNAVLKYVCPKYVNIGIPYYLVFDIDKVVQFNKISENKKEYKPKLSTNEINPINKKNIVFNSKLNFFNKKSDEKRIFSRIEKICATELFQYNNGCNYVNDGIYSELIRLVKELCETYNVCVNMTTIEGELINNKNIDIFLDFCLKNNYNKKTINSLISIPDQKEKVTLTRMFFDGRLDLGEASLVDKTLFSQLDKLSTKTDGWVCKWLDYFWDNYIEKTEEKTLCFQNYFPNLYHTLLCIKTMI